MHPFMVCAWDGTHIWNQWDEIVGAEKYQVRLRFRRPGDQEWGEWKPTIYSRTPWHVYAVRNSIDVPLEVMSQVRLDADDAEWQTAAAAKFVRSVCKFEFASKIRGLKYHEGVLFHACVDGAVCTYRLPFEIEVAAGSSQLVEMDAALSSGFSQLDKENDFFMRPGLGVTIRNVEPSRNDLQPTGSDYGALVMVKRDGPVCMAFRASENVR